MNNRFRLTLLIFLAIASTGCSRAAAPPAPHASHQRVTIKGHTFNLELALDDASRYQGLSDRPEIAPDTGMLFVFPRPRVLEFVMRRCLVPIDLIYLDPGGRVINTHQMAVEPYDRPDAELVHYASDWPAQFVIELRGGTLAQLQLKPADRIDLPVESLKARAR
ncbi:MAG: DUF192 domain-containing protein [Phycisphaeraceae bacterium]